MPKNISPNVFHYASLELMGKLAGAMGEKGRLGGVCIAGRPYGSEHQ